MDTHRQPQITDKLMTKINVGRTNNYLTPGIEPGIIQPRRQLITLVSNQLTWFQQLTEL